MHPLMKLPKPQLPGLLGFTCVLCLLSLPYLPDLTHPVQQRTFAQPRWPVLSPEYPHELARVRFGRFKTPLLN